VNLSKVPGSRILSKHSILFRFSQPGRECAMSPGNIRVGSWCNGRQPSPMSALASQLCRVSPFASLTCMPPNAPDNLSRNAVDTKRAA
jgi:hypothetical protein